MNFFADTKPVEKFLVKKIFKINHYSHELFLEAIFFINYLIGFIEYKISSSYHQCVFFLSGLWKNLHTS